MNERKMRKQTYDPSSLSVSNNRDPLHDSGQLFKRLNFRFQKFPILGLASHQRNRYKQMKSKIDKIRNVQQQIFIQQFNQFPDIGSYNADEYSKIWDSFDVKDEDVHALTIKLGMLCQQIDGVTKLKD